MNKHFSKEAIWMANRHMRRCSPPASGCKAKPQWAAPSPPLGWQEQKRTNLDKCRQGGGEPETLIHHGAGLDGEAGPSENSLVISRNAHHGVTPKLSNSTPRCILNRNENMSMKNSYTNIHGVTQSSQKQDTTQLSVTRCMEKPPVVCPHSGVFFRHRRKVQTHATTWTELQTL